MSFIRTLEKKLNSKIIDFLTAGSSINTKKISAEGRPFYQKVQIFFQRGLDQMSKDLQPQKKNLRQRIFGRR